jgi:hypothetical protein
MKLLQVKKYHREIADKQTENAQHSVGSMFYFVLTDSKGFPKKERERGYIAFTDNLKCAYFGMTEKKAIAHFERNQTGGNENDIRRTKKRIPKTKM